MKQILKHFNATDDLITKYEAILRNTDRELVKKILRSFYKEKQPLPSAIEFKKIYDDIKNPLSESIEIMGYIVNRGKTVAENSFTLPKRKYVKKID